MKIHLSLSLGMVVLSCAAPQAVAPPPPPPLPPPVAVAKAPAPVAVPAPPPPVEDPYLWLEDVTGDKPLAWVRSLSDKAIKELGTPDLGALEKRLLSIYDSKDRIPGVRKTGKHLYNFWRDDVHVRGIWRRTTLDQYRKKDPRWDVVLDVDALAKAENENWVFKNARCQRPKYERCLISLSRGGADAVVVREFDARSKTFVKGGFALEEAKSSVDWLDDSTIYVGTDFGPGSLTTSGYPRIVKQWRRGTPLADATTLFEGQPTDMSASGSRDWHQGRFADYVQRTITFYESETFFIEDGRLVKLDRPNDAEVTFYADFVLFTLRSDWTVDGKTWPSGALLAANVKDYRAGRRNLEMLYQPAANRSLTSFTGTRNALILVVLEDVHTQMRVVRHQKGQWVTQSLEVPGIGTYSAQALDEEEGEDDRYWFSSADFLQPNRLALGDLATSKRELLKTAPVFFNADGLETKQFFTTSKDGTRIPYFQVARRGLSHDGNNPVLLTGYGGFESPMLPRYNAGVGAAWLEAGGVFVLANIRGGGEYGPAWHQAGLKHHRQRVYDDFIAVAEDLIARKVTRPQKLGIQGGSNGGLLMGVMFTERPELWGAVVCAVPLLDMKRYHKLLAGASWMAEYGNPDLPDDWAAISRYSPYQNVKKGVHYPRVLFLTSTRDDRVHPGHARKMVARMLEQGHDLLYFENTEGGHAGAANNIQRAHLDALGFTYLRQQLMN